MNKSCNIEPQEVRKTDTPVAKYEEKEEEIKNTQQLNIN